MAPDPQTPTGQAPAAADGREGGAGGAAPRRREPFRGYSSEQRALPEYAALIAGFGTAFGVSLAAARRRRGELPERIGAGDVAMAGIATQKLSRLLAKDRVTSVV